MRRTLTAGALSLHPGLGGLLLACPAGTREHPGVALGIDWVAVIILVAAYAFAQVRSVPVAVRYGVFAAAAAIVALYKLRQGAHGLNLLFVVIAAALAVVYGVKALQSLRR